MAEVIAKLNKQDDVVKKIFDAIAATGQHVRHEHTLSLLYIEGKENETSVYFDDIMYTGVKVNLSVDEIQYLRKFYPSLRILGV